MVDNTIMLNDSIITKLNQTQEVYVDVYTMWKEAGPLLEVCTCMCVKQLIQNFIWGFYDYYTTQNV